MEEECSRDPQIDPYQLPISLGDREGSLRLSIHIRCPSAWTEVRQWVWKGRDKGRGLCSVEGLIGSSHMVLIAVAEEVFSLFLSSLLST